MGRWEPDAAGRLRAAALELFTAVGYEETTVAAIADRAGVTSRTFFRYFADKPEVLFAGSEGLEVAMAAALAAAPEDASPRAALDAALDEAAALLVERSDFARRRHAVILRNPALLERETMKMARLTESLAAGLRDRGVTDPVATMMAHAGVAAFRVAFSAWVDEPAIDLRHTMADNLGALARYIGSSNP
ncbi:TetR family transcriptional regulator [Raineyella sp. LH-20]|uniref:TetR family transcriptional regulator n=1 Tax=Raineyella sp. LH-20 TaxID=3081204 RepID=UPI002952C816|nr:TetR family transcriptional regulator [Raineyella sp. LH-20]WOP17501.1 TetR family transcriptional regulator [Raineyella sp. LH-20]